MATSWHRRGIPHADGRGAGKYSSPRWRLVPLEPLTSTPARTQLLAICSAPGEHAACDDAPTASRFDSRYPPNDSPSWPFNRVQERVKQRLKRGQPSAHIVLATDAMDWVR